MGWAQARRGLGAGLMQARLIKITTYKIGTYAKMSQLRGRNASGTDAVHHRNIQVRTLFTTSVVKKRQRALACRQIYSLICSCRVAATRQTFAMRIQQRSSTA